MRQALNLAVRARGRTSPNPMVGAVVYQGEELVGKGYHKGAGLPHAEVEALREAGDKAKYGTLYVTLEPCNHHGRTPPCCDAVLQSGVSRVVIGMRDPNPGVTGGGLERLAGAGLDVVSGVLENDCLRINEAFVAFMRTGRPFVILKAALTLDGKTATSNGDSKWITNEQSRRFVHKLRGWTDAIMVGVETALRDDPQLTCRVRGGKDPIRVIVDSKLRLSPQARMLHSGSSAPTWIATLESASSERAEQLERAGATTLRLPEDNGRVAVEPLLKALAARDVMSVLLEGGMTLNTSFMKSGLVDKAYFFYAPKIMGGQSSRSIADDLGVESMSDCLLFENIRTRRFGDDVMVEAYPSSQSRHSG